MQAAKQAEGFLLRHPHDRNGKATSDRYCTREIEEALNDYRYACDAARVAVRNQLKSLADTLQVLCCVELCFAVLRSAVLSHAVPRRAVPRCAALCCAVPCCAVPCCAVPCCAVPCCVVPCCAMLCQITLNAACMTALRVPWPYLCAKQICPLAFIWHNPLEPRCRSHFFK